MSRALSNLYIAHITPEHGLGDKFDLPGGRKVQYVYFDDAVDITVGMSLCVADDSVKDHAVTPDISGGSSISYAATNNAIYPCAGIALCAADISGGELYGFIQLEGRNLVAMTTDGNAAAGRLLVIGGTDGQAALAINATGGDPMDDTSYAHALCLDADTGNDLAIGDAILFAKGV